MKNAHPYAYILRAIADGEEVQWCSSGGTWYDQGANTVLEEIVHEVFTPDVYRIKPRTIHINGHEVPEPSREELTEGQAYYVPSLIGEDGAAEVEWEHDQFDRRVLERGLVHHTREAAAAHAQALLAFTQKENQ